MLLTMRKSGGREGSCSSVPQQIPLPAAQRGFSSSELDSTDQGILSLVRNRPLTVLGISKKMEISFIECLSRATKLKEMSLLKRAGDTRDDDGLFLYIARRKADPTPKSESIP
jgi:hypothetical protein